MSCGGGDRSGLLYSQEREMKEERTFEPNTASVKLSQMKTIFEWDGL